MRARILAYILAQRANATVSDLKKYCSAGACICQNRNTQLLKRHTDYRFELSVETHHLPKYGIFINRNTWAFSSIRQLTCISIPKKNISITAIVLGVLKL